jgi:excisionase family DNA binding protein
MRCLLSKGRPLSSGRVGIEIRKRTEIDLPGLDEFYRFIEKQGKTPGASEGEPGAKTKRGSNGSAHSVRYVLRNGITVAEPVNGAEEVYVEATDGWKPAESEVGGNGSMDATSSEEALAMWRRLPRHIQLLASISDVKEEEVARKYYTRDFKETRQQLINRLLNPTLTLEETARVLGVCPATVRRYTNRGVLPHFRTVGQQRRFRLSDVLLFLERQEQQAHSGKRSRRETAKPESEPVVEVQAA